MLGSGSDWSTCSRLSPHPRPARIAKMGASLIAAAAVSLCASAPALASSPVTILNEAHCMTSVVAVGTYPWQQELTGQIPTQTYSWLVAYRPSSFINYTNTAAIVWRGQLAYVTNTGGIELINQVATADVFPSSW